MTATDLFTYDTLAQALLQCVPDQDFAGAKDSQDGGNARPVGACSGRCGTGNHRADLSVQSPACWAQAFGFYLHAQCATDRCIPKRGAAIDAWLQEHLE